MHGDLLDRVRTAGLRRKLSPRTIKTYLSCIKKFLVFTREKQASHINKSDIKNYLEHLAKKDYTGKSLNVHYCAIKFLMEEVLQKRRIWIPLKFSKEQRRYPDALSRVQVTKLIKAIANSQHRLMIQLMYGAGLRVSELTNLKPQDIKDGYGWVRKGKGGKDRVFIIPIAIKEGIMHLSKANTTYLFTSNRKRRYSPRTMGAIIENASKKAGLPHIHPHMLRHSFATHLLDQGIDLLTVQALLGHASPATSMVYAHIVPKRFLGAISPLDTLLPS